MIVTRQRKKKKSLLPLLLPLAAIALLAFALVWPPSRNFIVNGPLKPVATLIGNVWAPVSKPLTFAYQQQKIRDENVRIAQLNEKLETERKTKEAKDAQVQALQHQISAAAAAARAATPAPAPSVKAVAKAADSGIPGAGAATPDPGVEAMKRTAAAWSAMDPAAAAAVAQKLPDDYVAKVFALMTPDTVGPVMEALPAKVAARIIQSGTGPQVSVQTNR